jgi:peroxiredoxin
MKFRRSVFGLLLVVAVTASACSASASTPAATLEKETPNAETMTDDEMSKGEAMADAGVSKDEAMMSDEMSTAGPAMGDEMSKGEAMADTEASKDEAMMVDEMSTAEPTMDDDMSKDEGMMGGETSKDDEMSPDETMMGEDAVMTAAWYGVDLTDVNTSSVFKVADFQGKVVLVETMAVWCSTCFRQQKEVHALHELLGERGDLVSLGLDIDPNETPDILKTYTAKNGFDWHYAVAPVEVAREISQLYGDQFLNPPSAPMFIIDRRGEVHPLPFGVKSAQTLQEALGPYLN